MLLSGLGPAPPTYHLLPIRVLAERREITLHAPRLTLPAYSSKGRERIFNGAAAMKP